MTFDSSQPPSPRTVATACALVLILGLAPHSLGAQMPGLPVLQNVFPNRGVTAGVNYGSTSGSRTYGAAAAFATIGSRFAASLGIGILDPAESALSSRSTAGLRVAFTGPRFLDRTVAVAAFAGFGGSPHKKQQAGLTNIPAGLAVGWRHAVGESRGIAIYAAPFYSWSRSSLNGEKDSQGLFRVSAGMDFSLTQRIGVTIGGETGGKAGAGKPGPTAASFGAGLAYAFR
jgi:hypothetical protein